MDTTDTKRERERERERERDSSKDYIDTRERESPKD